MKFLMKTFHDQNVYRLQNIRSIKGNTAIQNVQVLPKDTLKLLEKFLRNMFLEKRELAQEDKVTL